VWTVVANADVCWHVFWMHQSTSVYQCALQHMQALVHVRICVYTVYTHDIPMVAVSESLSSSERLYLHFSM
jgi:hypothetical protein